jgi:hypothetical protein
MFGRALVALVAASSATSCGANLKTGTSAAPPAVPAVSTEPSPSPPSERAAFDETVKPLLARTCAPCHVPGGRMYDRLPFDDPGTVASHSEGILRRLKQPEEKSAVEEWLRTRTAAAR